MLEVFKWFMDHDLPLKNATSGLVGLLSAAVFFFLARGAPWFAELQSLNGGVWMMLGVVFAIAFLTLNILWSFGNQIHGKRIAERHRLEAVKKAESDERRALETMYDTLVGLTDRQKNILVKQLRSGHPRFEAYEIGGYKVIWGPEIDELIRKKVVQQPSYDVFEVTPWYWNFLRNHYDLDSNTLSLDDTAGGRC